MEGFRARSSMDLTDMDLTERPTTIHADEELGPQGPWAFLRPAARGGFGASGWGLIAGWVLLAVGPAYFWAGHLMGHTAVAGGWSALPSHWGEQLSARDLVELFKNGEVRSPLGFGAGLTALLGLALVFWCGWRLQAEAVGLRARLGAWLRGLLDTCLVGLLPIFLVYLLAALALGFLGGVEMPALEWSALFLKPLAFMAFASTLNIQWWLLRVDHLEPQDYGRHLGHGFLRLWTHPIQWFGLAFGGALLRSALHAALLLLAWRLGGAGAGRVFLFVLLEGLAAAIDAWILGWLLRTTALYWRHDVLVRQAIAELKAKLPSIHAEAPELPAEDAPLEA